MVVVVLVLGSGGAGGSTSLPVDGAWGGAVSCDGCVRLNLKFLKTIEVLALEATPTSPEQLRNVMEVKTGCSLTSSDISLPRTCKYR